MGLGTKNRQKQTAELCKQHQREKYPDKLMLVEEFIVDIEGPPKNCDVTRWGQFTDIKDIKKEMPLWAHPSKSTSRKHCRRCR